MTATETLERQKDSANDEMVCHQRVPGAFVNYCGAPLRPHRFHTLSQCKAAGHSRCRICMVCDSRPQG